MLEIVLQELVSQIIPVVVTAAVVVITLAINKVSKTIGSWFDLDIAEWEIYNVAKVLYNQKDEHEDIFTEILGIVETRLAERGIKISNDELYDIISNALQDLKTEN